MMVIPPVIGVILILVGIVLFIVDLSVTNRIEESVYYKWSRNPVSGDAIQRRS